MFETTLELLSKALRIITFEDVEQLAKVTEGVERESLTDLALAEIHKNDKISKKNQQSADNLGAHKQAKAEESSAQNTNEAATEGDSPNEKENQGLSEDGQDIKENNRPEQSVSQNRQLNQSQDSPKTDASEEIAENSEAPKKEKRSLDSIFGRNKDEDKKEIIDSNKFFLEEQEKARQGQSRIQSGTVLNIYNKVNKKSVKKHKGSEPNEISKEEDGQGILINKKQY